MSKTTKKPTPTFHIVSLFPEAFDSYLKSSILKRAIEDKKIVVKIYNPRDFTKDKNHRVDQKPYGGGPGMVIEAEPVLKALEKIKSKIGKGKLKIIHLSPSGKKFTNTYSVSVSKKYTNIVIICGRYEGIDARVKKIFKGDEISIGDYVLTGGELPALVIVDSISRQIEGVLGNFDSVEEKRIASPEFYTRPEVLVYKGKKYKVPPVLLSGNHKKIDEWRAKNKK